MSHDSEQGHVAEPAPDDVVAETAPETPVAPDVPDDTPEPAADAPADAQAF